MISPHKVWIPGGLLWPSDIARHYEWVKAVLPSMPPRHWRRLVHIKQQRAKQQRAMRRKLDRSKKTA
jgi:hypothetical protein